VQIDLEYCCTKLHIPPLGSPGKIVTGMDLFSSTFICTKVGSEIKYAGISPIGTNREESRIGWGSGNGGGEAASGMGGQ
jgi:hypothetical protein